MNKKKTLGTVLLATLALTARAQDGARERAVARQIDAQVRGQAASQPGARGEDPVAKLVRVLDEGSIPPGYSENSAKPGTPFYASIQLRSLGPLAFDTIYRLLPELGPFGTKNALQLLAERPDERFARQLESMLAADAAKQVAAAELIEKVPAEARKPLSVVARASANAQVCAHGLVAAAKCGAAANELQPQLDALLGSSDPYVLGSLAPILGTEPYRGERGRAVLESLLKAKRSAAFERLVGGWLHTLRMEDVSLARSLVGSPEADAQARHAVAIKLYGSTSQVLAPVLADVVLELDSSAQTQAIQNLMTNQCKVSPSALAGLLARVTGNELGAYLPYLSSAPLDASHAPVLEAIALDPKRSTPLRVAALNALDRVAPDRVAARADDLLADDGTFYAASNVLSARMTPGLVSVAVRHIRRVTARGQMPAVNPMLDAIAEKSDASDLAAILELLMPLPASTYQGSRGYPYEPALQALRRWFRHEQIPELVGERWWQIVGVHAGLREIVAKVATPKEAGPLTELYFESLRRRDEDARYDGSVTQITRLWAPELLQKLAGDDLTRALTAKLADPDSIVRLGALRLLLVLPATDRKATVKAALAGPWNPEVAAVLGMAPEVAEDAELRDRFVRGVLGGGNGGIAHVEAWQTFLLAVPQDVRREIATDLLDAHQKGPLRDAMVVHATVRALGADRNPADAERFRALLRDPASLIREAAARELARMTDKAAVPGLLEALKDDNDEIRKLAKDGLQRLDEFLAAEERWRERLRK